MVDVIPAHAGDLGLELLHPLLDRQHLVDRDDADAGGDDRADLAALPFIKVDVAAVVERGLGEVGNQIRCMADCNAAVQEQ
jgi:hypothetical protein